jgi:tetratricopeptide (TPR) repeat protein
MRFLLLWVAGLTISVAAPAAGQSPAARDSIERFRERIATIGDSVTLLDLESSMIDRARTDRDNALLHVRLGFLAFRLGQVTGENARFDDAAGEFEWAAEIEPDWPYPWYGLGLAELEFGESSVIPFENLKQMLGRDYLSKAVAAFANAATVDPTFADAVVDLATTALRQRIRPRLEVALEAVRRAATTEAAQVAPVQLALGRLERTAGHADTSVAAFERYLALGGDSGVGFLETARSLYFASRPQDGDHAYYRGAALARSPRATGLYREDFGWAATEDELREFDLLPQPERVAWLRAFWLRRDVADVRAPGERLTEHYRRYFHALEHFPLVSRHRRYDVIHPYRNEQQVFDDRGIIYMRHGEPDDRAFFQAGSVNPNESWLYARSGENLIFHFVATGDIQDYKLVESLADVLGPSTALELQTGGPGSPEAVELFGSRSAFDPVYQRLAAFSGTGRVRVLTEERRYGERTIEVGTTTDAFPLHFDEALGGVVRRYVISAPTGRGGQILLVFAVPGASLVPEASSEGVTYRLGVRVAVMSAAGAVAYVDTTRTLTTGAVLAAEQYMTGFLAVPVPVGAHTLRVAFDQSRRGAGQVFEDTLSVPDFTSSFEMSDLIVGRHGSGLTWVAGTDSVSLSPRGRFPPTDTLQVYYEVHGLAEGSPYRSRLEVKKEGGGSIFGFFKRLFGGGGPPVSLRFDGVASGATTRILQSVDISALKPGQYVLRVTVEDPQNNQRIEREATLEVQGR